MTKDDNAEQVVPADSRLVEHSKEFRKELIEVIEGVYVAVGYGLANSVMIVGEGGRIIVDTTECVDTAKEVKADFDKVCQDPIEAIIYTHNHQDHVGGAVVFVGDDSPEIICQELLPHLAEQNLSVISPIIGNRAFYMYGSYLPAGNVINCGIGQFFTNPLEHGGMAFMQPTRMFKDELQIEIAGVKLHLVHAAGETNDQIIVRIPERKLLISADDFYKSFPNLYTIRGTMYRDVSGWINSVDKMRSYKPEYLVPTHGRPLHGAEEIEARLTNYRDAIQFVHDQTIRYMNKGLTPDEIVEKVKLPSYLANDPYLGEFYGTVEWAVREIYAGNLGWFNSRCRDLFPLPPAELAGEMAELAGGLEELASRAKQALEGGKPRWAAVLADHVLTLEPGSETAKEVKAEALITMAEKQVNANARNYLLSEAFVTRGLIDIPFPGPKAVSHNPEQLDALPLNTMFMAMATRLDTEKSADVDMVAGFNFPDTGGSYTVHVRRCVAAISPTAPEEPDFSLTMDSRIWKEMAVGLRDPAKAIEKGDIKIEGDMQKLGAFLLLFA